MQSVGGARFKAIFRHHYWYHQPLLHRVPRSLEVFQVWRIKKGTLGHHRHTGRITSPGWMGRVLAPPRRYLKYFLMKVVRGTPYAPMSPWPWPATWKWMGCGTTVTWTSTLLKSFEIYRPGSRKGGFVARRRWLPEWCVEEQKWCRRRCRLVVRGFLPGRCSYKLHRGGTPPQELALLPVVMPKRPGEGTKKGREEWQKPMEGDSRMQNAGILKYMMEEAKTEENIK